MTFLDQNYTEWRRCNLSGNLQSYLYKLSKFFCVTIHYYNDFPNKLTKYIIKKNVLEPIVIYEEHHNLNLLYTQKQYDSIINRKDHKLSTKEEKKKISKKNLGNNSPLNDQDSKLMKKLICVVHDLSQIGRAACRERVYVLV